MRVVTFYSYKGGVGRTLALLNVAATLLRRGNRVLLVDFDLEAPGLDAVEGLTFSDDYSDPPSISGVRRSELDAAGVVIRRGIVDLIGDYLAEGRVPDVRSYVAEAWFVLRPTGKAVRDSLPSTAQLLVLGAGDRSSESAYRSKLAAIDFRHLYRERDGFLLFDDLRTQWAKALECDYVLIDSRTGHTDIGAICTRQLPDHVIAVMFPNQQNLVGIEAELHAIRSSHSAECDLVLSRVPRLDDFEGELLAFEEKARKRTGMRRIHRVHSYDSLTLLQDHVYCADEYLDRTALSKEMRRLTESIEVRNTADPVAVLRSLRKGRNRVESVVGKKRTAEWLRAVAELHRDRAEVLEAVLDHIRAHRIEGIDVEAVARRHDSLTRSGERAAAAHRAIELESADPTEAGLSAFKALKSPGPLSFELQLATYAALCRLDPWLAERIELRPPSRYDALKVLQAANDLSRCLAGLRWLASSCGRLGVDACLDEKRLSFGTSNPPGENVPLPVSRIGSSIAAIPLFALHGSFSGLLPQKDLMRIQSASATLEADRLPVKPYGSRVQFAVWLWLYSRGHIGAPPAVSGIHEACAVDEDGEPVYETRHDLGPWEAAGVGAEADVEIKGRAVLAHLLLGQTTPLKLFLDEAESHPREMEFWNPWRLLPCRFEDFLVDLDQIRRDREARIAKSQNGAALAVLPPPFFALPIPRQ